MKTLSPDTHTADMKQIHMVQVVRNRMAQAAVRATVQVVVKVTARAGVKATAPVAEILTARAAARIRSTLGA